MAGRQNFEATKALTNRCNHLTMIVNVVRKLDRKKAGVLPSCQNYVSEYARDSC